MFDRDDDDPVGRVLDRREAVRLLGGGGAGLLLLRGADTAPTRGVAAQGVRPTPGCVARPEMTEGPYFVDKQLNRSDIRDGRPGTALAIALTVMDVTGGKCRPLAGAMVDLWQCDAKGVYSGVADAIQGQNTTDQKFLRGFQTTGADGMAAFTTIYPGWYRGRAVHIHFKIRTQAPSGAFEFTSQWYFDEALNDRILAGPEYARSSRRDTLNSTDSIYRNGGDQLLLAPTANRDALAASFAIGLDLANAEVGRADGFGRGRRGGRG
jgi:protocatechuate 3,4-dioxygenase beta subunit